MKLIVILGPTATGKSNLAINLAKKFNCEIVSADSRQIYKGMDIGTGKVTEKETKGIKHHLLSIIEPNKSFSSAEFKELATKAIKDIYKRGKTPILAGGSPFYIYPVAEGWVFPKTKVNKELRQKLNQKTTEEVYSILLKLDKEKAKNIDKNNKRRMIRTIEIISQFGKVPSIKKNPIFNCLFIGLNLSKKDLKGRIDKRVNKMIESGLEKEVKRLIKKYGWTPSLQSIGYQEWKEYFNGKKSKEKVIEEIKTHSLQLAKRQMTWFKKDKRINWITSQKQAEQLIRRF